MRMKEIGLWANLVGYAAIFVAVWSMGLFMQYLNLNAFALVGEMAHTEQHAVFGRTFFLAMASFVVPAYLGYMSWQIIRDGKKTIGKIQEAAATAPAIARF